MMDERQFSHPSNFTNIAQRKLKYLSWRFGICSGFIQHTWQWKLAEICYALPEVDGRSRDTRMLVQAIIMGVMTQLYAELSVTSYCLTIEGSVICH